MKEEIIQLEQDLIKIPSVNTGFMPTGNETEVCNFIQKWLNQFDIKSEILALDPKRGNLIATLNGSSNKLGLLFMSHLDVVPVEDENKWDYSPFGGEIFNVGSDNQSKVHTAEIYLTVRSPNQIYKQDRTIIITNHDPGKKGLKQTITDRYHRETFFASAYLRNIVTN